MQFKFAAVGLLAVASGAFAKQYTSLHCRDVDVNDNSFVNDLATEDSCAAYRKRYTGMKKWDICPDCTLIERENHKWCSSPEGHLGGKQFSDYCRDMGSTTGWA